MVVPIERIRRSKKYVGNDLILNIVNNKNKLAVTGNKCKIKIDENSGKIRVVGDHCHVTVLKGSANIEYVGNCGKIHLGSGVPEESVTYIGNEGEISTIENVTDVKEERQSMPEMGEIPRTRNSNVDIRNSSRIRITSSCIPSTIDISIPILRLGLRGQRSRQD